MRQVMSHDEHKYPDTILPGCKVLLLDEVHSGSTDVELILARILPRISQISTIPISVLMSATLNIDTFLCSGNQLQVWIGVMLESSSWRREPTPWHCTVSHQNF